MIKRWLLQILEHGTVPAVALAPLRITGDGARYNHRDGNDDYTQAGNLFRLMNPQQRERLFGNIVRHMQAGDTPQEIQLRQLCHFFRADPGYGFGVAKTLGIELSEDVVRNLVSASTGDGELVATKVPSSQRICAALFGGHCTGLISQACQMGF
jgi:hypothetical protein